MIEVIDAILADLAVPPGALHVERQDAARWLIAFAQDDWIEIERAPDRKILTFIKELAAPIPTSREAVHQLALQYNYIWNETGGGRLSLDGPDGLLVLSVDIALALVDRAKIEHTLSNFRKTAAAWKKLIIAFETSAEADVPEMGGWRRV